MIQTKSNLKKRGFDNPEEIAAGMCSMWAQENGVEREFQRALPGGPAPPMEVPWISRRTDAAATSVEVGGRGRFSNPKPFVITARNRSKD